MQSVRRVLEFSRVKNSPWKQSTPPAGEPAVSRPRVQSTPGVASRVDLAISSWESGPSPDGHHISAVRNLFPAQSQDAEEEDRATAAAAHRALMSHDWISKAGVYEALVLLTSPSIDKAFIVLAAVMAVLRISLFMVWNMIELHAASAAAHTDLTSDAWSKLEGQLGSDAQRAVAATEPERRLAALCFCSHLIFLCRVLHVCLEASHSHSAPSEPNMSLI